MNNPIKLNQRRWAVQLALTTGLALLFTVALLWGFGGAVPALADPGTLYVDGASGQDILTCGTTITPCQTISYTLNSRASGGDTIRVAQGTYTENLTINISVTLEGGYEPISWTRSITQYETIIDGSGSTTQSVVTIPAGNFDAVLDGFTITGGDTDNNGGGVLIWSDGSVIIANSVITGNMSSGDGGGIAAYGPLTLTMQNVTVANNQAGELIPPGNGGGLYFRNGLQATLTSVQVYSNTAAEGGGGIRVDDPGTSAVISDSQIYSNTAFGGGGGGGIGVSGAVLNMSNSWVTDNDAPNGQSGGIDVQGTVNIVDSIIADNSTQYHGGAATIGADATLDLTNTLITGNSTTVGDVNVFAISDGQVTVMNSTISDNNPQGGRGILLWSGHLTITNSIVWNNGLNLQGEPPCPTCFTVTYSDIQDGWTGAGNIDADPLFVGGGDYHLGVGSPCIDEGTSVGAPTHDIEGTPRDAAPDMGAYEWTGFRVFLPVTLKNFGP